MNATVNESTMNVVITPAHILKTLTLILTGLAALMLLVFALSANAQQIVELDRIIAVINDDVIVFSELESKVNAIRLELRDRNIPAPPEKILREQVMERLIMHKLQLQKAEKSGIRVGDDTLNSTISKIAASNGLNIGEFRRMLQRDGMNYAKFREDMRDQIVLGRLRNRQVINKITVSEQEINLLLANEDAKGDESTEYRIGHILIAVPDGASPETVEEKRQEALQIVTELRQGADFTQKAIATSDSQTALDGGDLGWRKLSQTPTIIAERIDKMQNDEISDPLQNEIGFNIIKLFETRGKQRLIVNQSLVRHIMIRTSEIVSDEDAYRRILNLKNRIENGESFAQLARANSDDSASAVDGGLLKWINPGEVSPAFEEIVNASPIGEVSDPFKTSAGWHILVVEDRRQHDSTQVFRRNKARDIIRKRKSEEELQLWLRRLRDEAYIEIRLNDT
ncbi:MAG: peptidylprolyl isomerase [Gammaproteobacteria bacterium]|nr:MAG: peptidylprolyl isomerase [Gammaproteobacteria bacterium]